MCAFVLGDPMRTQLEESLPCSSKVKDTRGIGDLLRSLFGYVDCSSLQLFIFQHLPASLHCVHIIAVSVGSAVGLFVCWDGVFYER